MTWEIQFLLNCRRVFAIPTMHNLPTISLARWKPGVSISAPDTFAYLGLRMPAPVCSIQFLYSMMSRPRSLSVIHTNAVVLKISLVRGRPHSWFGDEATAFCRIRGIIDFNMRTPLANQNDVEKIILVHFLQQLYVPKMTNVWMMRAAPCRYRTQPLVEPRKTRRKRPSPTNGVMF